MAEDEAMTQESRDHPQTVKGEDDARRDPGPVADADGASAAKRDDADPDGQRERASPSGDAQSQLSDGDAEAVQRHAQGGRSMGSAIGSSAGLDVGSGTPGDTGDLGGGDPQKVR